MWALLALASAVPSDPSDPVAVCKGLNISEKLTMMHGHGNNVRIDGYTRNSGCGGVCGRAYFRWDNGPQGFGDKDGTNKPGSTTQWPASITIGATFDPSLAKEWGVAMGEEQHRTWCTPTPCTLHSAHC